MPSIPGWGVSDGLGWRMAVCVSPTAPAVSVAKAVAVSSPRSIVCVIVGEAVSVMAAPSVGLSADVIVKVEVTKGVDVGLGLEVEVCVTVLVFDCVDV